MSTVEQQKEKIRKAFAEDRLITCLIPNSGNLILMIERHTVEQAMDEWTKRDAVSRRKSMESVRKSIKRVLKRVKTGKASQKEANDMAADVALWLGHELVFANGEQYLVKPPEWAILDKSFPPSQETGS